MRFARLSLMLLAGGAFSQRAHAETARFDFLGPDCTDSAPLLESRLEELVEPHERARLGGRVAVTRSADRYEIEMSIGLDGRSLGTRRFEASSCARAAETAAVAASLAVFAEDGEPRGAAESGIEPTVWTQRPDPKPDFVRPGPAPQLNRARPSVEGRLGAFVTLDVGALPQPVLGVALTLELGVGQRWSFALLGGATTEQRRGLREPQGVLLSAMSAAGRACGAPWLGARHRLDLCAGAQLFRARGRGEGFDSNRAASLMWVAPLLGARFTLSTGFIEWRAEVDGSVPLARRRFLVDGDEVSRAAALVATVRIGALLRFR